MTEEEYYAKIKAEYEASTDTKLVEWARPYFEGTKKPNSKDKYVVCPVSERAARDIAELTGSDVHGFNHILRCDEVAHVSKRHGKRGKADHSMKDISDLGRLAYVLNNYDEIIIDEHLSNGFLNKIGAHALSALYIKRINGHVFVAEAVSDSIKKKELCIESMYQAKTSAFLAQKKESTVDNKNSRPDARSDFDSVTNILPQFDKNVNNLVESNPDGAKANIDILFEQQTAEHRQARLTDIENMNIPPERKAELRQKIDEVYSVKPPTVAEVKESLRRKSTKEKVSISEQSLQKNKQKSNINTSGNKPNGSSNNRGNGSGR